MGFQQGLSGLNISSKSLEVIGNNVANANTYGYKSARAEFADMYAASLGGAGNNGIGIGARIANVAQVVVAFRLLSVERMLPWTLVLFAGAGLLVLTVVVRLKGNPWYAAAAVWGLVGVYAKQSESALAGASVAAYVALALAGLVAAVALAAWMRARRSPVPVRLSAG